MTSFPPVPETWAIRLGEVGRLARTHGLRASLVGGCVRDLCLGLTPKDWDVVIEGDPRPLVTDAAAKFRARLSDHPRFLTFTLHFSDGAHMDVVTARSETYPEPGHLPSVKAASMSDDARRRDFSANALYLPVDDPLPWDRDHVVDPTGGLADMDLRQLRVLHGKSFLDDPTRIFRGARYASRYGWKIETGTGHWIREAVERSAPETVSDVRLRHELFRALEEDIPGPGLELVKQWGVWEYWKLGFDYTPSLGDSLSSVPRESPPLGRLAVLLRQSPDRAEHILSHFAIPRSMRKVVMNHLRMKREGPL